MTTVEKLLIAMALALAIASPALAWDRNDEIREQGFEAQQALQHQMERLEDQQNQQQQRIYNQSLQMRAGGCWYNHSLPYC